MIQWAKSMAKPLKQRINPLATLRTENNDDKENAYYMVDCFHSLCVKIFMKRIWMSLVLRFFFSIFFCTFSSCHHIILLISLNPCHTDLKKFNFEKISPLQERRKYSTSLYYLFICYGLKLKFKLSCKLNLKYDFTIFTNFVNFV